MSRRYVPLSLVVLAAALLLSSAVFAQQAAPARGGGAPAPAPQNLQVLPKDMTPAQVLQVMQNIAQGLGVQCGYCHVQNAAPEGRGRGDGRGRGLGAASLSGNESNTWPSPSSATISPSGSPGTSIE